MGRRPFDPSQLEKAARAAYARAYRLGRTGKPQPGSRKYAEPVRRGWERGREEYNAQRQLDLYDVGREGEHGSEG